MTQRIIDNNDLAKRDGGLTSAEIESLQKAAENDSLDPRDVIDRVQDLSSQTPEDVPEQQRKHAIAYIESLQEPQRTMYLQHRSGVNHRDIARSMGLGAQPVLKSLARIYSDLRFILLPAD